MGKKKVNGPASAFSRVWIEDERDPNVLDSMIGEHPALILETVVFRLTEGCWFNPAEIARKCARHDVYVETSTIKSLLSSWLAEGRLAKFGRDGYVVAK